jgi:ketosteroid isomerase-like protein
MDLIRRAYAAYAAGNAADVFALFDPAIEIEQTPDLPWGGLHRGTEGAREFFRIIAGEVEALPQPEAYFQAGREVVVTGRLRGRARTTGKPIDLAIVHLWTVTPEARITRFRAFIDTPAMLAALRP